MQRFPGTVSRMARGTASRRDPAETGSKPAAEEDIMKRALPFFVAVVIWVATPAVPVLSAGEWGTPRKAPSPILRSG